MPKTRYVLVKSCKYCGSVGGSASKPPLASGGWSFDPDPVLLFSYAVATLYKRLIGSIVTYTLYHCHKRTNNELYTFRFLLGKQNPPSPPGHRGPSYAISNMTSLNVTSFLPPNVFFWRRHWTPPTSQWLLDHSLQPADNHRSQK